MTPSPLHGLPVEDVLGLPLHPVRLGDLMGLTEAALTGEVPRTFAYLNVHVVNAAARDPALREAIRWADLVYCDGEGVRLGANLFGGAAIPTRLTGADLVWDLAALLARTGRRLYWLGGREGIAGRAADALRSRHPDLVVAGTHHGYFDKTGAESEAVIHRINAARTDLLVLGFGTPIQELWARRYREQISAPLVWCLGATADFIVGEVPRGPEWMLRHGLEWLFRLYAEPRRLAHRYLVGNPLFMARMAGSAVLTRRGRRDP